MAIAEKRTDVNVTPWSHLVYALGESRAAVETGGRLPALKHARDLFATHLGFDPTHTGIADLAATLAGLSTQARIAQDDGFADVTAQRFTDVLDVDARSAEHLCNPHLLVPARGSWASAP